MDGGPKSAVSDWFCDRRSVSSLQEKCLFISSLIKNYLSLLKQLIGRYNQFNFMWVSNISEAFPSPHVFDIPDSGI